MFKKFSIVAVGVLAAMFVLSYTRMGSYMCTGFHKMRNQAEAKIPLEFELETLKHELNRLDRDIVANRGPVANQIVAVSELEKEVTGLRARLDTQKKEVAAMLTFLDDKNQTTYVIAGRELKRDAVEAELSKKVETGNLMKRELASKERQLASMEKSRDRAIKQLDEMKNQRDVLNAEIARLDADVKELRLAQTEAKVSVDDSRLSSIKERLAKIERNIKVQKTELELAGKYAPSTEDKPSKDVKGDARSFITDEK